VAGGAGDVAPPQAIARAVAVTTFSTIETSSENDAPHIHRQMELETPNKLRGAVPDKIPSAVSAYHYL